MSPIDDFYVLMEHRTQQAVDDAASQSSMLRYLFIALGLVLMFFLWRTYKALLDLVGTSVDQLEAISTTWQRGLLPTHQVPAGARRA